MHAGMNGHGGLSRVWNPGNGISESANRETLDAMQGIHICIVKGEMIDSSE